MIHFPNITVYTTKRNFLEILGKLYFTSLGLFQEKMRWVWTAAILKQFPQTTCPARYPLPRKNPTDPVQNPCLAPQTGPDLQSNHLLLSGPYPKVPTLGQIHVCLLSTPPLEQPLCFFF